MLVVVETTFADIVMQSDIDTLQNQVAELQKIVAKLSTQSIPHRELAYVYGVTALKDEDFSSGDTAWMLTSTALVLFMTLPGLALYYGGMVTIFKE